MRAVRFTVGLVALLIAFATLAIVADPAVAQAGDETICTGVAPELFAPTPARPDGPSLEDGSAGRAVSDLRCVELFSTARGGDAHGVVELGRIPSPFGVTVTADGHHVYELTAWIDGLPDPASLGAYTTYVAWATPLELDPVVPLGQVRNGENHLGRVAFNKYLIWVSAEARPDVSTREGPLVLRGRSPSSRMESHDLLAQAPSATRRAAEPRPTNWRRPPTYPDIPMLPGLMDLAPRVGMAALQPRPWMTPLAELPEARPREVVELPDGGTLDLAATVVRRAIAGREMLMLAFNGQHPGPLIKVRERSTIFVNFANETPFPTSVHWHGVRLDNRYDGVPGVTQDPVAPGETFRYRIFFRDAGIYWYHPHHREDVQQELGLYGNMLVEPLAPDYYGPVNREEILMLDDLLLDDRAPVPFGLESSNYMLMGRFGNHALVNGEPEYRLEVGRGEVVRFHLTNVSNTRTFNLSFADMGGGAPSLLPGRVANPATDAFEDRLPIKVVASDVGRFEREERVTSVVMAPAERYVVEVRFPREGTYHLVNQVQGINHRQGVFRPEVWSLGPITVVAEPPAHDHGARFERLREHEDVIADIDRYRALFDGTPDKELVMTLEVTDLPLPIEQSMAYDWVYFNPVEWTGTMPVMNWATTGREVRWILREPATGRENTDIAWSFRVGDVVKIRVTNDRDAFHAMQHPLHIHGQRFLVLAQDRVPNENLVWKDTVLLPAGSTADILLELSNPGRWMIHCHIAEHLESGMKLVMDVER